MGSCPSRQKIEGGVWARQKFFTTLEPNSQLRNDLSRKGRYPPPGRKGEDLKASQWRSPGRKARIPPGSIDLTSNPARQLAPSPGFKRARPKDDRSSREDLNVEDNNASSGQTLNQRDPLGLAISTAVGKLKDKASWSGRTPLAQDVSPSREGSIFSFLSIVLRRSTYDHLHRLGHTQNWRQRFRPLLRKWRTMPLNQPTSPANEAT